jgi:hypothetical protein
MLVNLSEYGLNDSDDYYEGVECKTCQFTYKYKKGTFKGKCVVCRPRPGTIAQSRKKQALYERRPDNDKYYEGPPCEICGKLLRYKSNRSCAECVTSAARSRYHHKKYLQSLLKLDDK